MRDSHQSILAVAVSILICGIVCGQEIAPVDEPIDSDRERIDKLLDAYDAEIVDYRVGPAALIHGLIAHKGDFLIVGPDGQEISCLDWIQTIASNDDSPYGSAIVERSLSGWRFTRPRASGLRTIYEAHFAQFLGLLCEADWIDLHELTFAPAGEEPLVQVGDLLGSLRKSYHKGLDTSWFINVLIAFKADDDWSNRFGETFDLAGVVRDHFEHKDSDWLPCRGWHWRAALCTLATDGRDLITDEALRSEIDRELALARTNAWSRFDTELGIFRPSEALVGYSVEGATTPGGIKLERELLLSFNAHAIEWLLSVPNRSDLLGDGRLHHAVGNLAEMLESMDSRDLRYDFRSHAIHALRLYVSATDAQTG